MNSATYSQQLFAHCRVRKWSECLVQRERLLFYSTSTDLQSNYSPLSEELLSKCDIIHEVLEVQAVQTFLLCLSFCIFLVCHYEFIMLDLSVNKSYIHTYLHIYCNDCEIIIFDRQELFLVLESVCTMWFFVHFVLFFFNIIVVSIFFLIVLPLMSVLIRCTNINNYYI